MKPWMRVFVILIIVLCAVGVGIGATTRARAAIAPVVFENCQVFFLDGPKQGTTDPVTFAIDSSGGLTAESSDYVGGASQSGSWVYADKKQDTVNFTFAAALAVPPGPGATLTVTTTIPVGTTTVVGTSQGTITNSSGTVLLVTHTTTTCPAFVPPPPSVCGCPLGSVNLNSWVRGAAI